MRRYICHPLYSFLGTLVDLCGGVALLAIALGDASVRLAFLALGPRVAHSKASSDSYIPPSLDSNSRTTSSYATF
jgi:hypothetical protein